MLSVPPQILRLIEEQNPPKATSEDVARIKALMELPVPESYFEFITRYGTPTFDVVDDPCSFPYVYREPELEMAFNGSISHFMTAERVERYYTGLVLDEDEDLPKFPAFMLPIGLSFGQDNVLLECGGESDRIWYWEFQPDAWGEGNNVRLGFVAPTFSEFLAALRVLDA